MNLGCFLVLQLAGGFVVPSRRPLADRACPKVRLKAPGGKHLWGSKLSFLVRYHHHHSACFMPKYLRRGCHSPGQCGWSVLEQTDSHMAIHPASIPPRLLTSIPPFALPTREGIEQRKRSIYGYSIRTRRGNEGTWVLNYPELSPKNDAHWMITTSCGYPC